MSNNFDIYEAMAKVHNDRYPNGPRVTSDDVRDELHRLLAIYGKYKNEHEERRVPGPPYRCSFCGKPQDQVSRLIAGPGGVYICDECVDLCQEIIEEEGQGTGQGA